MRKLIIIIIGIVLGVIIIYSILGYFKSNPNIITQTNTNKTLDSKTQTPSTNKPQTPTTKTPVTDPNLPITTKNLTDKSWQWVETSYSNGSRIIPKNATRFTLTFKPDGTFSSTTDCNGVGGKYVVKDTTISFSEMMSTLMYCEGSQENEYRKIFEESHTYRFTKTGELLIDLRFGAGSALFK